MKHPLFLVLAALPLALGTVACKSLNTDLGRNVYERELEDTFDNEPAGVVGTTADTRLIIFRENSFVAEPRPEGELLSAKGSKKTAVNPAPESSQGLRFFREASYRLAEARANSIEGMVALKEAGMDDRTIADMFPGREDWSAMYMNTLDMSREAIIAEFEAGTEAAELDVERELNQLGGEFEGEGWDGDRGDEDECGWDGDRDSEECGWDGDGWDVYGVCPEAVDDDCPLGDADCCDVAGDCQDCDDSPACPAVTCEIELGEADCAPPTCEEELECESGCSTFTDEDVDCAPPTCEEELECEGGCSTFTDVEVGATPATATYSLATTVGGLTTMTVASSPDLLSSYALVVDVPEASLEGTKTTPRAGKAWKIKYSAPERAGETIELVVHNLDAPHGKNEAPELTATFEVSLNKKGKGSVKADLPSDWRLVRLEAPGAKPLFAVFL